MSDGKSESFFEKVARALSPDCEIIEDIRETRPTRKWAVESVGGDAHVLHDKYTLGYAMEDGFTFSTALTANYAGGEDDGEKAEIARGLAENLFEPWQARQYVVDSSCSPDNAWHPEEGHYLLNVVKQCSSFKELINEIKWAALTEREAWYE